MKGWWFRCVLITWRSNLRLSCVILPNRMDRGEYYIPGVGSFWNSEEYLHFFVKTICKIFVFVWVKLFTPPRNKNNWLIRHEKIYIFAWVAEWACVFYVKIFHHLYSTMQRRDWMMTTTLVDNDNGMGRTKKYAKPIPHPVWFFKPCRMGSVSPCQVSFQTSCYRLLKSNLK